MGEDGIDPYKNVRLTKLLIPSGMGPRSWLIPQSLENKRTQPSQVLFAARKGAEDEIDPYEYVRLTRLLIPSGMGPLSWLVCKNLWSIKGSIGEIIGLEQKRGRRLILTTQSG